MGWARGAAVVAVTLAVALFGAWLLGWSSNLDPVGAVKGEPPVVEVPDLDGLARPRALADIESADLVADVETSFSLSAPRGAVMGQDPAAGELVPAGSTVTVVVSRGLTRVEMPEAVGRPIEEVTLPFDEVGVEYLVQSEASETVASGLVISQNPEPGVRVTEADQVTFVVSTGPDPRPVPEVAGLSEDGAAFALGSFGFLVGEVELREEAGVPVGAVVSTDPAAGTVSPRDTPVSVVVSSGPPPVAVPELLNSSVGQAVAALESVGLVANVFGGGASPGNVSRQSPEPGTMLLPGSLVSVELTGG